MQRLHPFDALRGLIMIFMALDHASAFIAKEHFTEIWGVPFTDYHGEFIYFITRFITHLCAPGFFLLMGVGMAMLAASREKMGWSNGKIRRHFVFRGTILLLVQQFIENPAWLIGFMSNQKPPEPQMMPGAGPESPMPFVFLGVLYALSVSMILWGLLHRLPNYAVLLISILAILATQFLPLSPENLQTAYHPLIRLTYIPGQTSILMVLYPVMPWMGLTGLGILLGRIALVDVQKVWKIALWGSLSFLSAFVVIRLMGGFGNLHTPDTSSVIAFFSVIKYPPSLAFILVTIGIDLGILWIFAKFLNPDSLIAKPVLAYGKVALFFYIIHLYLYGLLGYIFPLGSGMPLLYLFWLIGLIILYPLCIRYRRFKQTKPIESVWKFF